MFRLPRNTKVPCYECNERSVGCHAECERYKAFRAESEEKHEMLRDAIGIKKHRIEQYEKVNNQYLRKKQRVLYGK